MFLPYLPESASLLHIFDSQFLGYYYALKWSRQQCNKLQQVNNKFSTWILKYIKRTESLFTAKKGFVEPSLTLWCVFGLVTAVASIIIDTSSTIWWTSRILLHEPDKPGLELSHVPVMSSTQGLIQSEAEDVRSGLNIEMRVSGQRGHTLLVVMTSKQSILQADLWPPGQPRVILSQGQDCDQGGLRKVDSHSSGCHEVFLYQRSTDLCHDHWLSSHLHRWMNG